MRLDVIHYLKFFGVLQGSRTKPKFLFRISWNDFMFFFLFLFHLAGKQKCTANIMSLLLSAVFTLPICDVLFEL